MNAIESEIGRVRQDMQITSRRKMAVATLLWNVQIFGAGAMDAAPVFAKATAWRAAVVAAAVGVF
jgi:hypothetical protein